MVGGQSGSGGSSSPVITGLSALTGVPRARSAATIAAATTVLPTPVSVPVTNSPRNARGYAARFSGASKSNTPARGGGGASSVGVARRSVSVRRAPVDSAELWATAAALAAGRACGS